MFQASYTKWVMGSIVQEILMHSDILLNRCEIAERCVFLILDCLEIVWKNIAQLSKQEF